jgi:hypothetical protein
MSQEGVASMEGAFPEGTGVCVINLDTRRDRWDDFLRDVSPTLAALPVQRISATLGSGLPGFGQLPFFHGRKRDLTWAARGGCVLSHRSALLHARARNWSHVLVLEDDVEVSRDFDQEINLGLRKALEGGLSDVCYFGFTDPVPPYLRVAALGTHHALHRVFGCNTAHAYLLNRKAIDWIIARLPEPREIWHWLSRHRAVDRFYYRNLSPTLKVAALSPPLFSQKVGFSDIIGKMVESHDQAHQTTVPESDVGPGTFQRLLLAKARAFWFDDLGDRLRGFVKRTRGF